MYIFHNNQKLRKKPPHNNKSGYALLITVLISGVVLIMSAGILNVLVKGVALSSTARDSQLALYASDTGIECATFWDKKYNGNGSAFYKDPPVVVGDIVVGAMQDSSTGDYLGAVYTLSMKSDGTAASTVKIASGLNGGPILEWWDNFGGSVSSIGDLDGDGVEDIVVGARFDSIGGINRGAVYTLFMNKNGTAASTVKIASGLNGGPILNERDYFGSSVSSIGDLDGDGVKDIVVGAYRDDTGGSDRGAIYILFMNKNGTVASSVKIANNTNGGPILKNGDLFGSSVSSIGDLNNDGVDDIVVGAKLDDTGGSNRGAVYVLFMNSDGTAASTVKIASGLNGGPILKNGDLFGSSVSSIGSISSISSISSSDPVSQNTPNIFCTQDENGVRQNITDPSTGWDDTVGWDNNPQAGEDARVTFDMAFSNGTCADVTVVKQNGGAITTIESRGHNTCDLNDPRRVERAIRVRY